MKVLYCYYSQCFKVNRSYTYLICKCINAKTQNITCLELRQFLLNRLSHNYRALFLFYIYESFIVCKISYLVLFDNMWLIRTETLFFNTHTYTHNRNIHDYFICLLIPRLYFYQHALYKGIPI